MDLLSAGTEALTRPEIDGLWKMCFAGPDGPYISTVLARDERTVFLVLNDDGELAGAVVGSCDGTSDGAGPGVGYLDALAVHARLRRRGLARVLMGALESRLASVGCTELRIEGHSPHYLWPGVDVSWHDAICCVERLGYRGRRSEVNMDVNLSARGWDTSAAEGRLARDGVRFVNAKRAGSALAEHLAAGFKSAWVAEALAARSAGNLQLAWADRSIVGFCAAGAPLPDRIGPLGVIDEWRGRGIGEVLITRACGALAATGAPMAQVQWAAPLAWFSDVLGARTGRVFWRYSKPLAV